MAAHQILRVSFTRDVSEFLVDTLKAEVAKAPLFDEAPAVYVAGHERRARDIRRRVQAAFPEGTPERVARELIAHYSPEIELCGGVTRDFEFFACLHETLRESKSSRPATRALVDELIAAWRRMAAALPPEKRQGAALDRWIGILGERGVLLRGVISRYQRSLAEKHRADFDDVLWLAAQLLPQWRKEGFAPRIALIDELDALSPARELFLRALVSSAPRSLSILHGNAEQTPFLHAPLSSMQEIVVSLGGNAHPEIAGREMPRGAFVESYLSGEHSSLPASFDLRRPATREAEVRDTAREIKRLARAGVGLEQIAVAIPQAENYRGIIDETFDSAGIPFDSPLETPLSQLAPVAALLDLVRAARGGFERAEFLDALASPLLRFAASEGERNARLSSFERATRAAMIVGGHDIEKEWLDPLRDGQAVNESELAFLERLLNGLSPLTRRELKAAAFFDLLDALIQESGIESVLQEDSARGIAGLNLIALHEFKKLLADLRAGFARVGHSALPVSDLTRALFEQAATRTVRPPEADAMGIRILGLKELRGFGFPYVFVLGLTDQDLPLAQPDSMFFPRAVLEALKESLGEAAARELCSPIDTPAQADYLYANALLCGQKRLVLSFPRNLGENPAVPCAPHARLLTGAGVDPAGLRGDGDESPISEHTLALSAGFGLREVEFGAEQRAALKAEGALCSGLRGRAMELARGNECASPGPFEGGVIAGEFAKRFAPDAQHERHVFSPSQIDAYADCPMRFWFRYVLHVKRPEEPTRDTPPTAVGSLVHRVFELFVHGLRRELGHSEADVRHRKPARVLDLGSSPDAARERARPIMLQALAKARDEFKTRGPFWAGVLASLSAGLDGASEFGQGLLAQFISRELERNAQGIGIRYVELHIGDGTARDENQPDVFEEPVDLPLPSGFVRIMGSVDRVDESAQGLEIIDYKTGSAKSARDVRDGAAFQLPTYLAAVSAKTGVAPFGMSYLKVPPLGVIEPAPISHNKRGTANLDVAQLVGVDLPRRLSSILGALSRGVFIHLPSRPASGQQSPCNYCEYSSACAHHDDVIAARQARAQRDAAALNHAYRPEAQGGDA